MKPVDIRRWVHDLNATLATLLVGSGFLITYPELRARTFGGFSHQIFDVHLWAGWAFVILPLLALLANGPEILSHLRRRILHTQQKTSWRKFHLSFSLVLGVILGISGLLIWWEEGIPFFLIDISSQIHLWLTWVLCASVTVHIWNARRGIAGRLRQYYRRGKGWLSASPGLVGSPTSRTALRSPSATNEREI